MEKIGLVVPVLLAGLSLSCSSAGPGDGGGDTGGDVEAGADGFVDGGGDGDSGGDGGDGGVSDAGADAAPDADGRPDADGQPDAEADAEPVDAGGECDLVSGLGCGADQKCGLFSLNTIVWEQGCVPLPEGMVSSPGAACTVLFDASLGFFDNCPGGYMCLLRPGGTVRVCEKLCADDDRAACAGGYPGGDEPDGICVYQIGRELSIPGLMACTPPGSCDPTCQDCPQPPTGEVVGCYVATDGFRFGSICSFFDRSGMAGTGRTGEPCGAVNSCAPGYYCHSTRRCRPYCDPGLSYPGGDDVCPFALCESRTEPGVGACTVPEGAPEELFSLSAGVALCLE